MSVGLRDRPPSVEEWADFGLAHGLDIGADVDLYDGLGADLDADLAATSNSTSSSASTSTAVAAAAATVGEAAGPELPVREWAVAASDWLDEHARAAKAAGDGRSLDRLRADAFVDLVGRRSSAVARKPLVRVHVSAETLAGGDTPGEMAGYGLIDAGLARRLAADGTWQRIITDRTTGALTDIGPTR